MASKRSTPMRNDEITRFVPVIPSAVFLSKNPGILEGMHVSAYNELHHKAAIEALLKFCKRKGAKRTVNNLQTKRIHDGRAMNSYECQTYQGKSSLDGLQTYVTRHKERHTDKPILASTLLPTNPSMVTCVSNHSPPLSNNSDKEDEWNEAAAAVVPTSPVEDDTTHIKEALEALTGSWDDEEDES